jgi:EmrB/QacA subfamily drug resistance transporter
MTFIDGTVINVALPALQSGLDATITQVQWVIQAYALFLGALILVGGSLGDQLGRKKVFLFGVAVFSAASVMCGFAPNVSVLIGGRALQGFGAAFLVPGSLAIISATFDDAERGKAIGTWSAFSAITTAAGPILGGWLVEHVSWRAVFFINVPLAVVVLALSRSMDESRDETRAGRIDFVGATLLVLGLGALVLGKFVIGVALIVALIVVEARVKNPMMPLGLFKIRNFALTNVLTLLLYGALGMMMFILPMYLIQAQGYSATKAGLVLVPFAVILFLFSRLFGALASHARLLLTIGPTVAAIGFWLFTRTVLPAVIVLGLGMAITVAPLTTTVMGSVDKRHSGVASGVNNAVSRVAGLLAIAAFGVVLQREYKARVKNPEVLAQIDKMASAKVSSVEAKNEIRAAFGGAYRVVMFQVALLALASDGAGAFIGPTPSSRNRQP